MADDDENAPKKGVDLSRLVGVESVTKRLREQIDAITGNSHALRNALTPINTIQKTMEEHKAALDVARALPNVGAVIGIANASYHSQVKEIAGIVDTVGINASRKINHSALHSIHLGSIADMVSEQSAVAYSFANLGVMQNIPVARMLEGVRTRQSDIQSVISAYLDQQSAQAERISSIIGALAIPRVDPAIFQIGGALALVKTNAFKIAGLTPDYIEQFRTITGEVSEKLSAFAEFRSTQNVFGLQSDLVGGIGTLIGRALAQQEVLLEQQRELVVEIQPRRQTLIAERLTIIAAIVAILYTMLCVYVMLEERLAGGEAAMLENAAAIEENTRMLGQMRGSFDTIANQLERMRAIQEESSEDEQAADATIATILREISGTLTEKMGSQKHPLDRPLLDGTP